MKREETAEPICLRCERQCPNDCPLDAIKDNMEKANGLEALESNRVLHPLCPICKVYEMIKSVGIREYYCTKCGHYGIPMWTHILDMIGKED